MDPVIETLDKILHIYIHYIAKSIGSPLLMNRFDYFSNFYEYKS